MSSRRYSELNLPLGLACAIVGLCIGIFVYLAFVYSGGRGDMQAAAANIPLVLIVVSTKPHSALVASIVVLIAVFLSRTRLPTFNVSLILFAIGMAWGYLEGYGMALAM